jgi:hypothetical protein
MIDRHCQSMSAAFKLFDRYQQRGGKCRALLSALVAQPFAPDLMASLAGFIGCPFSAALGLVRFEFK